jgi:hypothetical protein
MLFTVAYQAWLTYHNIVTSQRKLSNIVLHIRLLHSYFTKWNLRVNINKTESILFTKCHPAFPCPIHGYPLESTYQVPWPRARLQNPLHKTLKANSHT